MTHTTTTCGDYSDMPYVSPLAGSVFCDAVASSRIHRLPEKLMTSARSAAYFVAPSHARLHDALAAHLAAAKARRAAPALPDVQRVLHASGRLRGDGDALVVIRSVASRVHDDAGDDATLLVDALDARAVDAVLTRLLRRCIDDDDGGKRVLHVCVANADVYVDNAVAACALSLLLLGIAAAAHVMATTRVRVTLTVLATTRGALAGDVLQAFCEDVLHLAVTRQDDGNDKCSVEATHARLLDAATSCIVTSRNGDVASWSDALSERIVDAHEQLCDEPTERDGKLRRPVIIALVPRVAHVRKTLRRMLADSYTSEPLHIVSDDDDDGSVDALRTSDLATATTPLVLLVSSAWLTQQARRPRDVCLLRRANVQCVVHGGYVECGLSLHEEQVHTLTLLQQLTQCDDAATHVCTHGTLAAAAATDEARAARRTHTVCELALADVLLVLFRRLLLRTSPQTLQPCLALSPSALLHDAAWHALVRLTARLRRAGVLRDHADNGTRGAAVTLELTAQGRVLSRRFRVHDDEGGASWRHALTCVDVKVLLWAHLLRQSRASMCALLLRDRNRVDDDEATLSAAVDACCEAHGLHGSTSTHADYSALVRALAQYALIDDDNNDSGSRLHRLLAAPHGRRCSVRAHRGTDEPTTRCRGWCAAAPLHDGVAADAVVRAPVRVSCAPPLSLYCELSDVATDNDNGRACVRVQCPVELSLPLLLVHCVLHISLHNNAVLCECGSDATAATALPLQLLQSPEMHALLQSSTTNDDNASDGGGGLWLDGCVASLGTLPSTSADMLAPLSHGGRSYLAVCYHGAAARIARTRTHSGSAAAAATARTRDGVIGDKRTRDADAFVGTRPRSATEAEAVAEFVKLVRSIGQERAERAFRGKRGFAFLDRAHELHAFYVHSLQQSSQTSS